MGQGGPGERGVSDWGEWQSSAAGGLGRGFGGVMSCAEVGVVPSPRMSRWAKTVLSAQVTCAGPGGGPAANMGS